MHFPTFSTHFHFDDPQKKIIYPHNIAKMKFTKVNLASESFIFKLQSCENLRGFTIKCSRDPEVRLVRYKKKFFHGYMGMSCQDIEFERIKASELLEATQSTPLTVDVCYYKFVFQSPREAEKFLSIYTDIYSQENEIPLLSTTFSSSFELLERPNIRSARKSSSSIDSEISESSEETADNNSSIESRRRSNSSISSESGRSSNSISSESVKKILSSFSALRIDNESDDSISVESVSDDSISVESVNNWELI